MQIDGESVRISCVCKQLFCLFNVLLGLAHVDVAVHNGRAVAVDRSTDAVGSRFHKVFLVDRIAERFAYSLILEQRFLHAQAECEVTIGIAFFDVISVDAFDTADIITFDVVYDVCGSSFQFDHSRGRFADKLDDDVLRLCRFAVIVFVSG